MKTTQWLCCQICGCQFNQCRLYQCQCWVHFTICCTCRKSIGGQLDCCLSNIRINMSFFVYCISVRTQCQLLFAPLTAAHYFTIFCPDAGVDFETLLSFTRDDVKDLFDGPGKLLLRKKIWNIIEQAVS